MEWTLLRRWTDSVVRTELRCRWRYQRPINSNSIL